MAGSLLNQRDVPTSCSIPGPHFAYPILEASFCNLFFVFSAAGVHPKLATSPNKNRHSLSTQCRLRHLRVNFAQRRLVPGRASSSQKLGIAKALMTQMRSSWDQQRLAEIGSVWDCCHHLPSNVHLKEKCDDPMIIHQDLELIPVTDPNLPCQPQERSGLNSRNTEAIWSKALASQLLLTFFGQFCRDFGPLRAKSGPEQGCSVKSWKVQDTNS